jgi:glucose/arabinose dehydrogenase
MRTLVLVVAVAAACGGKKSGPPAIDAAPAPFCKPTAGTNMKLVQIATGLTEPIFVTAPAGDPRLFIVERPGRIRLIGADGVLRPTPYLDISSNITENTEDGFLGLAFHPDFAHNPKIYIYYTRKADGFEVIDEYTVDPNAETVTSQPRNLLVQTDPAPNHNGGTLQFGPTDGYLYFGIGDGGGGGDTYMNGQNQQTLMAKISRIDPDHPAGSKPYGIPADNPWANGPGVPEMYLWGLRNPWRFSIDTDGTLWIGDVGQGAWEEIDVISPAQKGANLGWSIYEGHNCFRDTATCAAATGLTAPITDYPHDNGRCAIMGGLVYRGACMPDMVGTYFYADYCSGEVDTLVYANSTISNQQTHKTDLDPTGDLVGSITSFGTDGYGELYVCSMAKGNVWRIQTQ